MTEPPDTYWDQRFRASGWPTEPDPFLVELLDPLPVGKGVDLGSGPGRHGLWLARKGWRMTLVDSSKVALAMAREQAAANSLAIDTVEADVLTWHAATRDFDLALVAYLHPDEAHLRDALVAARGALRADGTLCMIGHHLSSLGHEGPNDRSRLLTEDRVQAAIPAGLTVDLLETRPNPPGAVVVVLARAV